MKKVTIIAFFLSMQGCSDAVIYSCGENGRGEPVSITVSSDSISLQMGNGPDDRYEFKITRRGESGIFGEYQQPDEESQNKGQFPLLIQFVEDPRQYTVYAYERGLLKPTTFGSCNES